MGRKTKRKVVPRVRPGRHRELHPDAALAFLRSYLSSKHLAGLLRICASLSCYDDFSPFLESWALKKYINYPHNRALLFAVLESKSTLAVRGNLSLADLISVLNHVRDASYDPQALDSVKELNGKPGVELEAHRFFARMGNIQIAHQEHNPIVSAGRTVAMLEVMPVSKKQWLSEKTQKVVDQLAPEFYRILGSSVKDLGRAHATLLLFCQKNFEDMLLRLPSREDESVAEEHRLFALLKLVLILAGTTKPFGFSAAEIAARTGGEATRAQIDNLLRVFGRQWSVHRELLRLPAYQVGHIASRLCPLERFPIVEMGVEDSIIPSTTLFSKSFPHVIDYTLFEELQKVGLGSDYSDFRGAMQEVYIRSLVEDCFSTYACVPERQYGKEHRRGPDLTLIDTKRWRLVVIESKSRRMRADTVALMSDEALTLNLADVFDALLKIPKKIEGLYKGLPEYKDVQSDIDRTKGTTPLCVVVLSNSVFGLTEIVRLQIARDHEHPLRDFPYPFCILSLDTFERAIELARSTGLRLSELFEEHWETSVFDPSSHIADMFKGRVLPETGQRFATKYF